jgi:cytoskeletal protein RodZ
MFKRIQKLLVGVAAMAALGFGGSAIVSAQTPTQAPAVEKAAGPDTDTIQSGDQTTPDKPVSVTKTAALVSTTSTEAAGSESASGSDGPGGHADEPGNANANNQSGDQSAPDKPATAKARAAESTTGTEAASPESASASDGPGGHADEPGNPNADHQAQGAE